MCGRYTGTIDPAGLAVVLALDACTFDFQPRYNIAPTQIAPVIAGREAGTVLAGMRWGLVPAWAENEKIGQRMINARLETAAVKPAFREAWKRRRCLVPADGFYEWERRGGRRVPWHFHLRDESHFCFAGLWESWRRLPSRQQDLFFNGDKGSEPMETFTILTTVANELLGKIHDRMPVMLRPGQGLAWLEEGALKGEGAFPADDMAVRRANPAMNHVCHEGADCWRVKDSAENNPWPGLVFD